MARPQDIALAWSLLYSWNTKRKKGKTEHIIKGMLEHNQPITFHLLDLHMDHSKGTKAQE